MTIHIERTNKCLIRAHVYYARISVQPFDVSARRQINPASIRAGVDKKEVWIACGHTRRDSRVDSGLDVRITTLRTDNDDVVLPRAVNGIEYLLDARQIRVIQGVEYLLD